ncbi:MAG: hypothetical protein A2126_03005 [Candidatus Woykebacteria bacterium GWB1_45_5]|uniref:Uncharacterized protein n=1 Tax=Candidatus Woykebacteria bacterium GWB1_45_5 TaxID=1802592 RepID=A0A1G1W797_9BACT|nr:MAG: hypothetical protein A2126_03005 [Candidatus Woykebacteria bacterium GWB1_45_5]
MRGKVAALATAILAISVVFLTAATCEGGESSRQREESIETRAEMFARAKAKIPIPRTENFPLRAVLAEYTRRQDLINHPWYTYIMSDDGRVTHYFVSTAVPVNSCAFLSSTEDVETQYEGDPVLTAPSLDGIYYGGSGAASACNGWIFIDAATGVMGMAFGTKIMTFDAPLILETEPILIRPVAPE